MKIRIFSAIACMFMSQAVSAGGTAMLYVGHRPLAESIPTLQSSMLIVLAALLGLLAYRVSSRSGAGLLRNLLVAGSATLVSIAGGVKLVGDAYAPPQGMIDPEGGVAVYSTGQTGTFTIDVQNNTGVPQRVMGIEVESIPPFSCVDTGNGSCVVLETVLEDTEVCTVEINCVELTTTTSSTTTSTTTTTTTTTTSTTTTSTTSSTTTSTIPPE